MADPQAETQSTPDPFQQAENWLLVPEHDLGQELKHKFNCGRGVVNNACELCRLSIMLPAYAKDQDPERDEKLKAAEARNEALLQALKEIIAESDQSNGGKGAELPIVLHIRGIAARAVRWDLRSRLDSGSASQEAKTPGGER